MSLRLVPFNPAWITHDKIDLHAIYRRPRHVQDAYGEWSREKDGKGIPTWDITAPLPVKQHNKWIGKGYEYVTLADRESLMLAAQFGTIVDDVGNPCPARVYDQHQVGGPWNWKKYHEGQEVTTTREYEELVADVNTFGSAVVEHIRKRTDRHFTLPDHLKRILPGGKKEDDPAPSVAKEPAGAAQ